MCTARRQSEVYLPCFVDVMILILLALSFGVANSQFLDTSDGFGPVNRGRVLTSLAVGYAIGKLLPTTETTTAPECETGWLLHQGKCYFISTDRKQWLAARKTCRKLNSHLATLRASDENTWVKTAAAADYNAKVTKADYWFGCQRILEPARTVWDFSFEPLEFSDFDLSVTNVQANKCCNLGNAIGFRWAHKACTEEQYYICERKWNVEFEYKC